MILAAAQSVHPVCGSDDAQDPPPLPPPLTSPAGGEPDSRRAVHYLIGSRTYIYSAVAYGWMATPALLHVGEPHNQAVGFAVAAT